MTSKIFASQGDFTSRVVDTIVFFKGGVFYARPSPGKNYCLDLYEFPNLKEIIHKEIHVDEEALYLGGARLGYFNAAGSVYQVVRTPARRYRYGTPPEYLNVRAIIPSRRGVDVFNHGFRSMLLNQYPSVGEAIKSIKSKTTMEVAISRHFWLKENQLGLFQLHFKDLGPVLWVSPEGVINFVEKTQLSSYLNQCSRSLIGIIEELRIHAV